MTKPSCENKIRYPSRKKAMDLLKRRHAMARANMRPEHRYSLRGLRPYYCEAHDCWHLGHAPGSSKR